MTAEGEGIELLNVRQWPHGPKTSVDIGSGRILSWGTARTHVERRIDCHGGLVLPGLVNIHAHLDKAGLAQGLPNVSGTIHEARARMRHSKSSWKTRDIYDRAKSVIESSVTNGVTAIRSHVDVDPTVRLKGVSALLTLKSELQGSVDLQIVAFPQEGLGDGPETQELMEEAMRMGVDVVGSHLSILDSAGDVRRALEVAFGLARRFDKDIDVHTDFALDFPRRLRRNGRRAYPSGLGVVHLAERTMAEGYEGRVTASHVCGLDSITPPVRADVVELLARANISVVALPASNLYSHGRDDAVGARRGITRVRELIAGGVRVAIGTDNIRDPFDPYLGTDVLLNAILAAITCGMVNTKDFEGMIDMHSSIPADIMGLEPRSLDVGSAATLVALEATNLDELLDGRRTALAVVNHGRLICEATISRSMYTPHFA